MTHEPKNVMGRFFAGTGGDGDEPLWVRVEMEMNLCGYGWGWDEFMSNLDNGNLADSARTYVEMEKNHAGFLPK